MLQDLLNLLTGEDKVQKENELSSFDMSKSECKIMEDEDYEVYNFDEEDLEEDDYYYEDED